MLSNHLIFSRRVYNKIGGLSLVLLLSSCSINGITTLPKGKKTTKARGCKQSSENIDQRVLVMSARHKAKKLGHCFLNYLQFEKSKEQVLNTCHQLHIQKSGRVSYIQVTGIGKVLSRDLEMCMEQEYWKTSFSNMQLEKGQTIRFPMKFSSFKKGKTY